MKKRKELDALLMNGKKSRPKRTKDGHELLQNMDSESNSSELDEFIMQPRKQTVVRRKDAICSLCIRLFVFILVVGCIAITAGVVWMHMELKNDLDDLRKRLEDVESKTHTTALSELPIADLQSKAESIPALITKVGNLNTSISSLQEAIKNLQKSVEGLQTTSESHSGDSNNIKEDISQIQQQIHGVRTDLTTLEEKVTTDEESVTKLQTDVTSLEGRVTVLSQSHSTTKQPAVTDELTPLHFQSVRKSLDALNKSISSVNETVNRLDTEFLLLKGADTPEGILAYSEVLNVLRQNVTYLMRVVQKETSSDENPEDGPTDSGTDPSVNSTAWQNSIESRLSSLEVTVSQFNPQDLNNNLLNNETARGFQTILEQTYGVFRDEVHNSLQALEQGHRLLNESSAQHDIQLTAVSQRLDVLESKVSGLHNVTDETKKDGTPPDTVTRPGTPPPASEPAEPPTTPESTPARPSTKPSIKPTSVTTERKDQVTKTVQPEDGVTEQTATTEELELQSELLALTGSSRSMRSTSLRDITTNHLNTLAVSKEEVEATLLVTLNDTEVQTEIREEAHTSQSMLHSSTDSVGLEQSTTSIVTDKLSSSQTSVFKTTVSVSPTVKSLPVLTMDNIHSYNDLNRNFPTWDRDQDRRLSYLEFSLIRPLRKQHLSKDIFLSYDNDHDSHLSKTEMQLAMHL